LPQSRDKRRLRRAATPGCPALVLAEIEQLPTTRQQPPLELGQDELFDLRRAIAVDQHLDPGLVLVGGANRDQIDVGSLRVLAQDRILDRIRPALRRVVGVDRGSVNVVERARRLRRVDLDELQLLGILA
jgi:hypothetical protein